MGLPRQFATAALLALAWALLAVATPASAHLGASAFIIVPADHILPGERFDVVGTDMGASSEVAFHIVHEPITSPLETITAGTDGHFRATLSLPADFPTGYAQLSATATDGTRTSAWVLVGARTASTPPPPGTGPWWSDPSVIVLGVMVVGILALVAYVLLRGAAARPAPVPAASTKAKRSRR